MSEEKHLPMTRPLPYFPETEEVWNFEEDMEAPYIFSDDSDEELLDASQIFEEAAHLSENHTSIQSTTVLGMEVGDDRVDLSLTHVRLSLMIVSQEKVFGMITSKEDTAITSSIWDFCEVTSGLPTAKEQSFEYCRKRNKFDEFGFVDVPPLRIVISCGKEKADHSSSVSGKAALLGSRAACPRTELREVLHQSLLLQDAYLCTSRASDPKYLPRWCGGSGAPCLFDRPENLYLYTIGYRGGGYHRIYGTAVEEAKQAIMFLEQGQPATTELCKKLRMKQNYLHGTYAHMVAVPNRGELSKAREMLPMPAYLAAGSRILTRSVEHRLLRARLMLPQVDAEIEFEKNLKYRELLTGTESATYASLRHKKYAVEMRRKYDGALCANTAFQRLLSKTASGTEIHALEKHFGFQIVTTGMREFTLEHAFWIHRGARGLALSADDIPQCEAMYFTDEVSLADTLKVPGIDLKVQMSKKISTQTTRTKFGLYQIGPGQEKWAQDVANSLRARRDELKSPLPYHHILDVFSVNTEWINDDALLISKARHLMQNSPISETLYLISNDRKLANRIADSLNIIVYLVDPLHLSLLLGIEEWTAELEVLPVHLNRRVEPNNSRFIAPHFVLHDYGSIFSAVVDTNYEGNQSFTSRKLIKTGQHNKRYARYSVTPLQRPRYLRFMVHKPVSMKRRPRMHTVPSSDVP